MVRHRVALAEVEAEVLRSHLQARRGVEALRALAGGRVDLLLQGELLLVDLVQVEEAEVVGGCALDDAAGLDRPDLAAEAAAVVMSVRVGDRVAVATNGHGKRPVDGAREGVLLRRDEVLQLVDGVHLVLLGGLLLVVLHDARGKDRRAQRAARDQRLRAASLLVRLL